jgi:hypothetical protein
MNTIKRRRIAIALVTVPFVVLGALLGLPANPGITKGNLNLVKVGMTRTEVERYLGRKEVN